MSTRPSSDPDLSRAVADLYARRAHGIKPGLEAETRLLAILENPQKAYPVIHVAGTNGKGSVCAILERILRAAGYRTGLYTSPHLVALNERFRVDGAPISDNDMAELLKVVEESSTAAARELGDRKITFFEFATAMAFQHFANSAVDVAVVETGMGGRLDATNVVDPIVSVITNVDFDHTAYLGDSLSAIAFEKCGIIKPGRSVVCGAVVPEVAQVVRSRSAEMRSRVMFADESVSVVRRGSSLDGQKVVLSSASSDYGTVRLPLLGRHQLANVATAVAAAEEVSNLLEGVSEKAIRSGLEHVSWPGRLQVLERDPPMILDSAHNPGGARALVAALEEISDGTPIAWITGFLDDKDVDGFACAIRGSVGACWVVPIESERAMEQAEVCRAMAARGISAVPLSLTDATDAAVNWARDHEGMVVIAGSIYLAGEVLKMRGPVTWG